MRDSSGDVRPRRWTLVALVVVALCVRALIGVWANGRGEMEGLAYRYEHDAYAIAAGYGFVRPFEGAPPQVNLLAYEDSLEERGERIAPANAPAIEPQRWRPSTLHPPGYAGFLAAVYRVFGNPLIPWAKAVQALLDSLACVGVYAIGRRLAGPRVGLFAGWAVALFLPLAYLVTSRVADSLMPAWNVLTFYLYVRGLEAGRMRWFALAGLALGLSCLFRPDGLLLPGALGIGALLVLPWRRAVLGSALLGVVALAVLVPWGLRNLREHGTFNVTTHAGGMTLYESIGQFPNPYGIVFDDGEMHTLALRQGFEGLDDPRADRWFKQRFLGIVRENPGLIASQVARRIPLGVMPLYRWGYDNPNYEGHGFYDQTRKGRGPFQAVLAEPGELFLAYWDRLIFGIVSLLLFVANVLLLTHSSTRRIGWILFLPYLYVFAVHLPLVMGARLFVPVVFVQWIAVGVLLERLRRPTELRLAFR
jgi:4-amino-4-deoxy-L-arabinose transferase-like glycosyltransferase